MRLDEVIRPYDDGTDYDDSPQALGVLTMADGSRKAYMLPARAKRLEPEARETFADLQHIGAQISALHDQVDELVPQLRDLGVAWSLIGFALGITGEAARLRWGDLDG